MSYQGASNTIIKAFRAEGGAIAAKLAVIPGTAANQVKLPTGANQMPIAISLNAVAEGEWGDFVVFGFCDVTIGSGTDVAVGDPLTTEATTGHLVLGGITNGLHSCARAYEAATEDGHVISAFFCPFNYLPTA